MLVPKQTGENAGFLKGKLDACISIKFYVVPWCRATPFVTGLLLGYVLYENNGQIKLQRRTVVLGWLAATILGYESFFGFHGHLTGESPLSREELITRLVLLSPCLCFFISWIIVACVSGYGGLINSFLTWTPFVVLSRLTFVANLIHWNVMEVYIGNMHELLGLTNLNVISLTIALTLISYLVSFIIVVCLEYPLRRLENVLLRPSS